MWHFQTQSLRPRTLSKKKMGFSSSPTPLKWGLQPIPRKETSQNSCKSVAEIINPKSSDCSWPQQETQVLRRVPPGRPLNHLEEGCLHEVRKRFEDSFPDDPFPIALEAREAQVMHNELPNPAKDDFHKLPVAWSMLPIDNKKKRPWAIPDANWSPFDQR